MKSTKKSGKDIHPNSGVLFINSSKDKENHPDWTGTLTLTPDDFTLNDRGEVEIRLAAWQRVSEKAGEYLSIRATPSKRRTGKDS